MHMFRDVVGSVGQASVYMSRIIVGPVGQEILSVYVQGCRGACWPLHVHA